MYQILATKMALATTSEVTQAVSMQGANAVTVDITVFAGTVSALALQGSNDLENWTNLNTSMITSGTIGAGVACYLPGSSTSFAGAQLAVSTQYVRLKITSSAATVVACGINTALL